MKTRTLLNILFEHALFLLQASVKNLDFIFFTRIRKGGADRDVAGADAREREGRVDRPRWRLKQRHLRANFVKSCQNFAKFLKFC